MEGTPKRPDAWPLDTPEGARLIVAGVTALMSGQGAVAYLRPSVEGFRLMAKELLDDAEVLAASAMNRSRIRQDRGPLGEFFQQRNQLSRGLMEAAERPGHE